VACALAALLATAPAGQEKFRLAQMHQRYVDQQLDAQDAKDRRELIEKKAKEQELLKAAKESK
jgi:hypothetical protein